jgi:hypothetical protein|tara:strand:- start:991 stop:1215 length:225 start_codon:yes stop_codon:yes gene_type:complete
MGIYRFRGLKMEKERIDLLKKVAIAAVMLRTSEGDSIRISEYRLRGNEWITDHRRMLLGKRNLSSFRSKRSISR